MELAMVYIKYRKVSRGNDGKKMSSPSNPIVSLRNPDTSRETLQFLREVHEVFS
jgi:hypothetical protein